MNKKRRDLHDNNTTQTQPQLSSIHLNCPCESIKIHSLDKQDLDGFGTVHRWYHYLTSPKSVSLSYCAGIDLGEFGTALARNAKGVRVRMHIQPYMANDKKRCVSLDL